MNTGDHLAKHGNKDQTCDDLINELLDQIEFDFTIIHK